MEVKLLCQVLVKLLYFEELGHKHTDSLTSYCFYKVNILYSTKCLCCHSIHPLGHSPTQFSTTLVQIVQQGCQISRPNYSYLIQKLFIFFKSYSSLNFHIKAYLLLDGLETKESPPDTFLAFPNTNSYPSLRERALYQSIRTISHFIFLSSFS